MLDDALDDDMRTFVRDEIRRLEGERDELLTELRELLRPRDPNDEKNVIVEIRAGTGGEEAGLFAGELMRMYMRYAEGRRWKTEPLNTNETDLGGIKEAILEVRGKGAYSRPQMGRVASTASSVYRRLRPADVSTHRRPPSSSCLRPRRSI